jgi:hypothetical protein
VKNGLTAVSRITRFKRVVVIFAHLGVSACLFMLSITKASGSPQSTCFTRRLALFGKTFYLLLENTAVNEAGNGF